MNTSLPVGDQRGNAVVDLFGRRGALIGVVHLLALPGAPRHAGGGMAAILERATRDADAYLGGGLDGLIVENHGDGPFAKPDDIGPETAACMAVVTDRLVQAFGCPIGINVLANAAVPALATAVAGGARFVRVNQWANAYVANEGLIEGAAARAMRYRRMLGAGDVRIFADAHVKHGAHAIVADRPVEELVRDVAFFDADAVIATGQRTGHSADLDYVRTIAAASHLPTLVGSGATPDNVAALLGVVDGVIVASALKRDGVWWNPVDRERVRAFATAAGR
ncbi:MAG: BtpA/SgcQ family protein [Alphaproteobacteria bacterium]